MTQDEVLKELNAFLNQTLKTRIEYAAHTPLLGMGCIMDSVSAAGLVAWCDSRYKIDLLDGDLNLDCLNTLGNLAGRICAKIGGVEC